VVGLELTAPYAEGLTVEARLALARDRSRRNKPTNRPRGVRVYHRRARGLSGLLRV